MKGKNLSPERRTPRTLRGVPLWLRGLLIVILIAVGFGISLITLDICFGIKVPGISYSALSKIMGMMGAVIYIGVMGYFLKRLIKEIKDKKLTLWQKIVKWITIVFVAGTIPLFIIGMMIISNWLPFSFKLIQLLGIATVVITLPFVVVVIIYHLFSKEGILSK